MQKVSTDAIGPRPNNVERCSHRHPNIEELAHVQGLEAVTGTVLKLDVAPAVIHSGTFVPCLDRIGPACDRRHLRGKTQARDKGVSMWLSVVLDVLSTRHGHESESESDDEIRELFHDRMSRLTAPAGKTWHTQASLSIVARPEPA